MADKFQKRIVFYSHAKEHKNDNTAMLIFALFGMGFLFSVLAMLLAILALCR